MITTADVLVAYDRIADKHVMFAAAGLALVAAVILTASLLRSLPEDRRAQPLPGEESWHAKTLTYAQRWAPVASLWTLEREDRLVPGERLVAPLTVKTLRIAAADTQPEPEPVLKFNEPNRLDRDDPPPRARARIVSVVKNDSGICAKHGMRKVFSDGGKKWRCKK